MTIENESINAMKAVQMRYRYFVMIFESMEDAYMRERAADIKDVSKRIISNLAGKGGSDFAITESKHSCSCSRFNSIRYSSIR